MSRLFAGLDVSTQSCKLVVIDLEAAEVVHVDAVNYDDDLPEFETRNGVSQELPVGASESDPLMWLAAVDMVLDRLRATAVAVDAIASISVSAQQHGLVALDSEGRLTRPMSKLWNDHSTVEECRLLTERVGGLDSMIEAIGNSQRAGYTAGKILHMRRHEPESYERTSSFLMVHDFINWYLSGGVWVTEPGEASGTALWSPVTGEWSRQVIDAIDPGLTTKLPEVRPATRSIGRIAARQVDRFGFAPGCRVDAGCGDNMYGALGTGNVRAGMVTVTLGTSGTVCTFRDEPVVDPVGEIACRADSTGHYLSLLCVSNFANGYNEMRHLRGMSHSEFDRAAGSVRPGQDGSVLIPWFGGERTPDLPHARPVYFGFSLDALSSDTLCRAVLDGHVLNLHAGFDRMAIDTEEIRVTGGLARSGVWCQTLADVFDTEIVPVAGEGAALGAALHAAWVWSEEQGEPTGLEQLIEPFVTLDQAARKRPQAELRSAYRYLRRQFRALSRRLRGLEAEDPFELCRSAGLPSPE